MCIRDSIKAPGVNVWTNDAERWSEAALAMGDDGLVYFVFCQDGLTMPEFNRLLLSLPLGILRAMHLEGGPEASLSIRSPALRLDLRGSYETGFFESDANGVQWPIPNVLGVVAAGASEAAPVVAD